MTAVAAPGVRVQAGRLAFGVLPLLALAVFINYVDRGNLATAAPLIKGQLHLSATEIGLVLSAFFWTYTPAQILAGWLSEKINAYRTLAIGLAIWSLSTAAMGLAGGFWSLIGLRLALGLGESAAFPCSSKIVGEHLPHHKLGHANGLIGAGLALGPAFGTFFGGMLMAYAGWRLGFVVFGLASLLWLVPWWLATRNASKEADRAPVEKVPSFLAMLGRREAWGACLGHFANNYVFYFVISWLPLYLVKVHGFSVAHMAEIGGMIYLVYAASALATGWVCDWLMRRGVSASLVRKTAMIANCLTVAGAMAACALGDAHTSIIALFVAGVAFGFSTTSLYAIGQTLAGPRAAGKWVALQNCVGNAAGIVAPLVTGMVVDRTGQFFWAFAAAGGVALLGVLCWTVLMPRVAPLAWEPDPAKAF